MSSPILRPLPRSCFRTPACTRSVVGSIRTLVLLPVVLFAAPALLSPPSAAQDGPFPDFDLRIDAPDVLTGKPGETVGFDAEVVLSTRDNPGDRGAKGWSLSIAATGVTEIIVATTEGTAAAPIPDGFLRVPGGLVATEITTGEGNEGVTSAVVLSATSQPSALPPEGDETLLRLLVEASVPQEGCADAGLVFRDGLEGGGSPVTNAIVFSTGVEVSARRDDGGTSDNDDDEAESASVPVCVAGDFVRGNCDSRGSINITDVIFGLQFLFLGTQAPLCPKACDANDSGGVDLTDAVFLLGHLFLGEEPPPAPFPACGPDLTDDDLECAEQEACG